MWKTQWSFVLPIHRSDVLFIWKRECCLCHHRVFSMQIAVSLSKTHCSSPIFNMQGYIGHSQWPLLCGIPAFSIWKSQCSPTGFPPKSQCSPLYIYNHKDAPPLEGANPLSENHAPVINALHSLSNGLLLASIISHRIIPWIWLFGVFRG